MVQLAGRAMWRGGGGGFCFELVPAHFSKQKAGCQCPGKTSKPASGPGLWPGGRVLVYYL